ncbi:glycosyltransferase family 4 protein [Rubrobacter aplysinae]|uniref:glycosyltransferase family 4 protein n=1 Tax=Rubrobacter aplysinae TaxID=909625 RepID=UPI00064BFAD0|nr:glycosyltransferase family 1 protein [Rubrobacter aplysinae]
MRVAIFTETFLPATDGVVTRLRHTISGLTRMGDEVMVLAPRTKGMPRSYAGAEVVGFPGVAFPPYPQIRLAPPHPGVGRALRRFRPDVIHVVNPILLGLGGIYHARRNRIPLVASYHTNVAAYARYYNLGFLEGFTRRTTRMLHNQADVNLCTSESVREDLVKDGIKRVRVWPHGVDSALFHPDKAGERWRRKLSGGDPEKMILAFVGRVAPEKNIGQARAILERVPDTRMAIIGDGPARRATEREFAGTPTVFTGLLQGEDLAGALASVDVFVLPSTTETLGMVTIEALASGVPVLAARSGASEEILDEGHDGLIFEPGSEESLVGQARRLLGDAGLREKLSRNARATAEKRDWTVATRRLRDLYGEARDVSGGAG